MWTVKGALEDKPRTAFTFATAVVLAGSSVEKNLAVMNGKRVLPGVASEQQQPPHCNGRQGWSLPSPPLCSHTLGCRHRCRDSDRFAWNEPFRFLGGGEGGMRRAGDEDAERLCTEAASASAAAAAPAAETRQDSSVTANGRRRGRRAGPAQAPVSTVCGGMDATVTYLTSTKNVRLL